MSTTIASPKVVGLTDLPPELLRLVVREAASISLWKTGDKRIMSCLVRGGVSQVSLLDRKYWPVYRLPSCLSSFAGLVEFSISRPRSAIMTPAKWTALLQLLSSTLETLILDVAGAPNIFLLPHVPSPANNAQANIWSIKSYFPRLKKLVLRNDALLKEWTAPSFLELPEGLLYLEMPFAPSADQTNYLKHLPSSLLTLKFYGAASDIPFELLPPNLTHLSTDTYGNILRHNELASMPRSLTEYNMLKDATKSQMLVIWLPDIEKALPPSIVSLEVVNNFAAFNISISTLPHQLLSLDLHSDMHLTGEQVNLLPKTLTHLVVKYIDLMDIVLSFPQATSSELLNMGVPPVELAAMLGRKIRDMDIFPPRLQYFYMLCKSCDGEQRAVEARYHHQENPLALYSLTPDALTIGTLILSAVSSSLTHIRYHMAPFFDDIPLPHASWPESMAVLDLTPEFTEFQTTEEYIEEIQILNELYLPSGNRDQHTLESIEEDQSTKLLIAALCQLHHLPHTLKSLTLYSVSLWNAEKFSQLPSRGLTSLILYKTSITQDAIPLLPRTLLHLSIAEFAQKNAKLITCATWLNVRCARMMDGLKRLDLQWDVEHGENVEKEEGSDSLKPRRPNNDLDFVYFKRLANWKRIPRNVDLSRLPPHLESLKLTTIIHYTPSTFESLPPTLTSLECPVIPKEALRLLPPNISRLVADNIRGAVEDSDLELLARKIVEFDVWMDPSPGLSVEMSELFLQ